MDHRFCLRKVRSFEDEAGRNRGMENVDTERISRATRPLVQSATEIDSVTPVDEE